MTLGVIWRKLVWRSSASPGFAAHGGLVGQIEALSEIVDATLIREISRAGAVFPLLPSPVREAKNQHRLLVACDLPWRENRVWH